MNDQLSTLPPTLEAFLQGHLSVQDLAHAWRDATQEHEPALPERYLDVLERVLNQLESAALFTEESCSFSQADMVAALADWLTKARAL
ncbi:MAG: hypothetical protein EPO09_14120 [Aquabacterium sp.]|uniref:hypothetical protein n=1 Tax=Aquabacterium sp. TaxID=1872578 RepID=UPI00122A66F2|nr:hypothetical protein [Aquabacterium sp.]TAK92983.1 MAG: hypothetical protein EPO09_14120 [Aquabacterium sp.]